MQTKLLIENKFMHHTPMSLYPYTVQIIGVPSPLEHYTVTQVSFLQSNIYKPSSPNWLLNNYWNKSVSGDLNDFWHSIMHWQLYLAYSVKLWTRGSFFNPFRTKIPKYLFPRGNEPLLYHQIGNRNFFIFITNQ